MIPKKVIRYHSLKYGISFERCIELFKMLENFFQETLRKGKGRPTKEVDEVWHTFILHTQEYENYCCQNYGSLIHHNPHMPNEITNCDGTVKPKPEDECDSAFISKIELAPCDSTGNPDGPNTGNDCDSQFYPNIKSNQLECIK